MLAALIVLHALVPASRAEETAPAALEEPETSVRARAPHLPLTNIRPSLTFGLFGHTGYEVEHWQEDGEQLVANEFEAAAMDLFMQASVGKKVSFVGEIMFEFEDGMPMADVERALVMYSAAPWLRLQAGKGDTPLGYWNETFHHGAWLQTTAARPVVMNVEGGGGFLPMHFAGVGAGGELGFLHYNVIVGNGRAADPREVLSSGDVDNGKQVTVEVTAQPTPGLGFGVAGVAGGIPAGNGHLEMAERIVGLHAYETVDPVEFVGEGFVVRHTGTEGRFQHYGAYAQVAYTLGQWKPYYRWDWLQKDEADPYYPELADAHRHTVGVRWDFEWFCALKVEASRGLTGRQANRLQAQISFAF